MSKPKMDTRRWNAKVNNLLKEHGPTIEKIVKYGNTKVSKSVARNLSGSTYFPGKLPVRRVTGTLARAYEVRMVTPYLFAHFMNSSVANYAKYVHEGTRYLKPRPYFRNALNDNRQGIMAIRQAQAAEDLRKVIKAFLESLQSSSPWDRWSIVFGYPSTEKFELDSLIVFVMLPKYLPETSLNQKGANMDLGSWVMRLGVWDSRLAGGTEEIGLACSQVLYTFRNKTVWSDQQFTVTLATAQTDTTLINQGITVQRIDGPFEIIKNTDTNEFRYEFDLYLRG